LTVRRPTSKRWKVPDRERSLGFDRIRIEDESSQTGDSVQSERERAVLVGICLPGGSQSLAREHLDELDLLARTAGAEVVDRDLVTLRKIDPATFIGRGKVTEIAELANDAQANLIVFDEDLAPAQTRNLEQRIGRRILERSGLILDIFARRAQSREARTQVELAQLHFMLPRLSGAWTHLERQKGGIGLRGPGETQIETDRRIIRDRIRTLKKELEQIEQAHLTQRASRGGRTFRFALAGYTNVGKSTLMNVLTGAGVYEEDLLFATLDSTTRSLRIGVRQDVLISDTVGFIRKLPPDLVASFRSTLAEIKEANCIIHVIDLASPAVQDQIAEVEKLFAEMEIQHIRQIRVFNKVDALEDQQPLEWARREYPDALYISARQHIGIDKLEAALKQIVTDSRKTYEVLVAAQDGKLLSKLHQVGDILTTEVVEDGLKVTVSMLEVDAHRLGLASP
jgi:GTP-binding protein HflX